MDAYETIQIHKTRRFAVRLEAYHEALELDFDDAEAALAEIDAGRLECFRARVLIVHIPTDRTVGESMWLGQCLYHDVASFNRRGDYLDDLTREAIEDARSFIAAVRL